MISMINSKQFYLFSVIFFDLFIDTELVSLRGRPSVDETCNWFASHYFPIGIIVVIPVLVVSWIRFVKWQKKKEKMREDLFEQNGGNLLQRKLGSNSNIQLKMYTAQDMRSMTDSYKARNVELRDCHPGVFYRGTLSEDDEGTATEVAVVRIESVPRSQIKRFVEQLIFLSIPHRNLVRIRGCCLETESPLIVYELRRGGDGDGNGTLFDCINYRDVDSCFPCEMRVKAAAGVARGLAHLNSYKYSKSNTTFVHGNICSANILLDTKYNAKIFYAAGSNLLISSEQEKCVYKDPQLTKSKRLNNKSDVYSFGVVLAELLRGREVNDRSMALKLVLDEEMSGEGDSEVVRKVAALALKCLKEKPGQRPFMKEVEATLSKLMQRSVENPCNIKCCIS